MCHILGMKTSASANILRNSIPEQEKGWGNDLMQNETLFLIFDGAMILIAISCLTIFHPQFFFPFLSKKQDKKVSAGPPPAESGV